MEAGRHDDTRTEAGRVARLHDVIDRLAVVEIRVWAGAAAAAVLLVGAVFLVGLRMGAPDPVVLPMATTPVGAGSVSSTAPSAVIHVHVAGEVQRPGLYVAAAGSRVADLVDAAGGPTGVGDLDRLNLATVVRDGDRIEVPAHGAPVASGAVGGGSDGPVDLNRADAATLETLPGIGPALAAAIVESRERDGPFSTIDDLTRVSGIGPATVARLRDLARV
jgi:competence protein ComEA